jgi:hypothetical protein
MIKESRKKSNDPVQEALRTRKDKWNLATTELISRIIAFKRALNGRGDNKYSLPPSKIQDPFPSEVISFLNQLSSNYEAVAKEAYKIISDQAEYSKQRKKPKTASLISNGSNKLTRLLTYLKSPFLSGDDLKKVRISLLKKMAEIYSLLDKLEYEILSSSKESISLSKKMIDNIDSKITNAFNIYKSIVESWSKDIGLIDFIIKDFIYAVNIPNFQQTDIYKKISPTISKLNKSKNNLQYEIAKDELINLHNEVINYINSLYDTNFNSIQAFLKNLQHLKSKNDNISLKSEKDLKSVATNFITKWLKKQKHNINPLDVTSANRLKAYEKILTLKESVNKLMDVLENNLDEHLIKEYFREISKNMSDVHIVFEPLLYLVNTENK